MLPNQRIVLNEELAYEKCVVHVHAAGKNIPEDKERMHVSASFVSVPTRDLKVQVINAKKVQQRLCFVLLTMLRMLNFNERSSI